MQINEYVKLASRTRAKLGHDSLDNLHMLFGLVTEIGELTDIFKKSLAYKRKKDDVNIQEEIGDLMWYLANLCDIRDYDLEEILKKNIDKLMVRYPEKFSTEKATNRDLKEERKSLESESITIEHSRFMERGR